MNWKVPLTNVTIGPEEEAAALRVLRSGWLTMGSEVAAFEEEFAEALGVEHAIAAANATDGLALSYDAACVERGDEIIMPALTFVASLNVANRRGEKPVLVDICSENDLTMCPDDLEAKITEKTKLIVTMPYGGYAPDMDRIMEIAKAHDIPVIEDACHGILSTYKSKKLGTFGLTGVFSFYGNKNMTTGEGGMIVTNDRSIAERTRLMRSHGITKSTFERYTGGYQPYDVRVSGHNFRMCELRGAIGREQLKKLPDANQQRREMAARIRNGIRDKAPEVVIPFYDRNQDESSHHLLPIIIPKTVTRKGFMARMMEQGVETSVHYRPLHRFSHTTGMWPGGAKLPRLEAIEDRLVTLPLGPGFSEEQQDLVVEAVVESLL